MPLKSIIVQFHISEMFQKLLAEGHWQDFQLPMDTVLQPAILKNRTASLTPAYHKRRVSYMSPCPHPLPPSQPVGRRICRWPLWSSRCSPAPWLYGGVACGRGGPRWGLPRQQLSGGSRESWTSLSPAMVRHPLWKSLMGGYRGTYCRKMNERF